jgi:hypothetical protein
MCTQNSASSGSLNAAPRITVRRGWKGLATAVICRRIQRKLTARVLLGEQLPHPTSLLERCGSVLLVASHEYSGSLSKRGGFAAKREIDSLNMHACRVGDGLHRRTRIAVSYEELCGNFGDMSAGPRSLFLSGVAKARAYALCAY